MANFDTLCISRETPCVVWRAALPSGWIESTITQRLVRAGVPDSSHFYPGPSSTLPLRDDHGAGVHRRGCGSLSEHAGRRFLLRWQVRFAHTAQQQRRCQHHLQPLLHLSSPVTSARQRRGHGSLRFCMKTCHKPLLIFKNVVKSTKTGRKRGVLKPEWVQL